MTPERRSAVPSPGGPETPFAEAFSIQGAAAPWIGPTTLAFPSSRRSPRTPLLKSVMSPCLSGARRERMAEILSA